MTCRNKRSTAVFRFKVHTTAQGLASQCKDCVLFIPIKWVSDKYAGSNDFALIAVISKERIDRFVNGPTSAEAVKTASMAFKKALLERVLGAELTHHLVYAPGANKPLCQGAAHNKSTALCAHRPNTCNMRALHCIALLASGMVQIKQVASLLLIKPGTRQQLTCMTDMPPSVLACDGSPGFVKVLDARTLPVPDAPGKHRLDSLKNNIATGQQLGLPG